MRQSMVIVVSAALATALGCQQEKSEAPAPTAKASTPAATTPPSGTPAAQAGGEAIATFAGHRRGYRYCDIASAGV